MEKEEKLDYSRIFVGIMFLIISISKFFYFKDYVALIPFGNLSIYAAIIVTAIEIICGSLLILNKKVKYSSSALILVLIGALIFVIFPHYALNENILNFISLPIILLHLLAIGILVNLIVNSKEK